MVPFPTTHMVSVGKLKLQSETLNEPEIVQVCVEFGTVWSQEGVPRHYLCTVMKTQKFKIKSSFVLFNSMNQNFWEVFE
jgi:hypothetical protein